MPSLAILIDAENMPVAHAPAIIRRARTWGALSVVRLFGDFTSNRHAGWSEVARAFGYEIVQQPNGGRGKNSTDIALTINAMDLLHRDAVDGFCLVSNDRDFLPLATRLANAGKPVYAIGGHVDKRVTCFSDKFELTPMAPPPPPVAKKPPTPPIVAAFLKVSGGSPELTLAQAGMMLRRHAPKLFEGKGKKGALRKLLKASGRFEEVGAGGALRIRLKAS